MYMPNFGCILNFLIFVHFLFSLFETVGCKKSLAYYFEIVHPGSLSYSFEVWSARDFGSTFTRLFQRIPLVLPNPLNCCSPLENSNTVKQAIVLADRGECSFVSKAYNAENAGAMAIIITDSTSTSDIMIEMINDDTNRKLNIPALYLPGNDGRRLRHHLLYESTPILINIPLNLTLAPLHTIKKPPWNRW